MWWDLDFFPEDFAVLAVAQRAEAAGLPLLVHGGVTGLDEPHVTLASDSDGTTTSAHALHGRRTRPRPGESRAGRVHVFLYKLQLPTQRKNASGPQEDVGASLRVVALPQSSLVVRVVADPGRGVVVLGREPTSRFIQEPAMTLEEAQDVSCLSDTRGRVAPVGVGGFAPPSRIESDRRSGLELSHARTRT